MAGKILEFYTGISRAGCVARTPARGPPTIHKDIKLKEARLDLSCDHRTRVFVGLTCTDNDILITMSQS